MGRSGTDVAREAADIVLLDDDFATIVEAVAQGRATFHNVERFLTYHLTDNVAELTPFIVTLHAASGAAFLAVVLGQKANAWACRSTTLTPWQLGWFGNRLLVFTAIGEMMFALVCLGFEPIANALQNRFPPLLAGVVAAASIPAVWLVDALWKRRQLRVRMTASIQPSPSN